MWKPENKKMIQVVFGVFAILLIGTMALSGLVMMFY